MGWSGSPLAIVLFLLLAALAFGIIPLGRPRPPRQRRRRDLSPANRRFRFFAGLAIAVTLLAGSFVVAPAVDQAFTQFASTQGPALPLDQFKAPKLAKVASLTEALSPKAAAYAEGNLSGCNGNPSYYCYVQWCTAYPGGGTTHFTYNRNGSYNDVPIYGPTGVTGCNNWSKIYMQYGMQMIYAYSDRDSVYWMSGGQVGW